MARITGFDGGLVTQAAISSITCSVYDASLYNTPVLPAPTVSVSTSIFDTLQTHSVDSRWTADSTGYNFSFAVPGTAFPKDHTYRVEFKFLPTSTASGPFYLVWRIPAYPTLS